MAGHIALFRDGVPVGSVDASSRDALVFRQRFAVLHPRHLALASVKSGSAVGAHGEGFKVAINFLLQRGYRVTYTMDGQRWEFLYRALHDKVVQNMVSAGGGAVRSVQGGEISCPPQVVVFRRTGEPRDDLLIEVHGAGAGALFDIKVQGSR